MSNKDGRIPLNVEALKTLRQRRGLSQDKLAELCFEQGYVVSLSSIKRAEAGVNVLYRTAKNLAGFYGIPVERLLSCPELAATESGKEEPFLADTASGVPILQLTAEGLAALDLSRLMSLLDGSQSDLYQQENYLQIRWYLTRNDDHIFREVCRFCDALLREGPERLRLCLRSITALQPDETTTAGQTIDAALKAVLKQIPWGSVIACPVFISSGWFRRLDDALAVPDNEVNWSRVALVPVDVDTFVGRQKELRHLQQVIRDLANGQSGKAVCLYGMAGIGKTRLLSESLKLAESLSCRVSNLQVLNRGMADRLSPLNLLVRALYEFERDDDDDFIRHQIAMSTLPSRSHLVICWLMGVPLGDTEKRLLEIMDFATIQAATEDAIKRIMSLRRGFLPRIICLEDVHWADETLLLVVRAVLDTLEQANILLLMTFRQQNQLVERQDWFDQVDLIELSSLSDAESIQLARQLHPDDEQRQRHCLRLAKGHPLYLRQTLLCAHSDNRIPESLEQLVLAQMSQLPVSDLGAIKAASVFGQCFGLDQLRFVVDNPAYLPDHLLALGLIKKAGRQYMFHHDLICTAVNRQLAPAQLQSINRRCAEWYQSHNPFLYAVHYHQAGADNAYEVLIDTARAYLNNFHPDQALLLIDAALGCAGEHQKALVLNLKGNCLYSMGRVRESLPLLEQAAELVSNSDQQSRYWLDLVTPCRMTDQISRAMTILDRAQASAEACQQYELLADIHFMRGNMLFPLGDMTGCEREHLRSLEYSDRAGSIEARAKALGGLGDCAYAQARMTAAYGYLQECLRLCSDHQLIRVEASNRYMLGTVLIYQLKFSEALQQLQLAANLANLTNNRRAEIVSRMTAGWVLLDLLALEQAEREIEMAMQIAESLQANRFIAFLLESRARLQWLRGQPQAAQTIAVGLEMVTGQGMERFIGPWLCATRALVNGGLDDVVYQALRQGEQWLASPCVGHNYLRFYQQGIQVAWELKDQQLLQAYRTGLYDFTRIEPNPWADLYIQRADLMLGLLGQTVMVHELLAFNGKTEQLGLKHLAVNLSLINA